MASPIMDVQRIVVTLSESDVVVEPGSVAQVVVTMTNAQDAPDRLLLEVEGVDVEWYMIPVPAVNVAPGAQTSERILFKVARASGNRAGSYPFLVRVLAMETGAVGVAQATLEVKPYASLQTELNPKRTVASFFHPDNIFDFTVSNLGNSEETIELYASDPEDGCAYEFDMDRITLKPGQSEIVPLGARPRASSVIGGARLYGFSATARSVADAYLSANSHGQIEKRALISPLLGIFLLLLGAAGAAFVFFRPQPPQPIYISRFAATPKAVQEGQPTTLTWEFSPNTRAILRHSVGANGTDIAEPDAQQPKSNVGSITVTPQFPFTTYTLEIQRGDNQQIKGKPLSSLEIKVVAAPKPKPPKISGFSAEPSAVHAGEPVTLRWSATNTTGLILDPGNFQLSPFEQTKIITPADSGDTEYTLRALPKSPDMQPDAQKVTIHVVGKNTCLAKITGFAVSAKQPYIGDKVRLKWKTRYAHAVRIDRVESGPATPIGDVERSGSLEAPVTEETTFTITATDSAGLTTTQSVTVSPKERPAPPPQTTPTPDGTTPDPNATNPNPPNGGTPASNPPTGEKPNPATPPDGAQR